MAHDPDQVLPLQEYTVGQFLVTAVNLRNDENMDSTDATFRSLEFVLTGRHPDHQTQAVLTPLANQIPPDTELILRRDYDSLIGFTDFIPIAEPINVCPVSRHEDTLSSNIHIKVPFPLYQWEVSAPM